MVAKIATVQKYPKRCDHAGYRMRESRPTIDDPAQWKYAGVSVQGSNSDF
jgi:hypothetical protein